MSQTLYEITKDAITELEDWLLVNPQGDPTDSEISEIADTSTPTYNSDILELAAQNLHLALDAPELGPAFDGSPTPINIIAANIYEHIHTTLYRRWEDIEVDTKDDGHTDVTCYLLMYRNNHDNIPNCLCECHEEEEEEEN